MKRLAVFALVIALTGCATATPEPAATDDALSGTINVFAAASLTESFAEIADAFTETHPDVKVVFNFGGSSALAEQIVQAAPADVFAAASPATMQTVVDASLADEPADFASNTLELAVPVGNPGAVEGLADLAKPDLAVALCAAEVPCGAAAITVLETVGIEPSVDTYEQDVKAVLTKVELGEVDTGLVYTTDVLAAGDKVEGIAFAEAVDNAVAYPIATLTDSENAEAAAAFVDFVLSDEGQAILTAAGFGAP